ncbi:MAG: DJ-1/PfpI family protein, partial [Methanotrichaceae archaeon]|nr:DJ-1/PfpI family protein [Methanotrichaceae archaeon]
RYKKSGIRMYEESMKILMPLTEGFEEIEAITVIDILRRAEIEVVVAGLKDGLIEGAHKVKVLPDTSLEKIDSEDFDGVVLPGGYPGYVNLGKDERILNMVREMDRAGKYVAAICCAPYVLIKAGVLQGRKATISPSGKKEVSVSAQYCEDRVVVDRKLITSQSPGTAMEFALKLVEVMAGEEAMKKVKAQTLAICKGD